MKPARIAVLAGDGVGPEVTAQAVAVLKRLGLPLELAEAPVGGAAIERTGEPLPAATLALAREADAVLFGAVGDARYDRLPREKRPEQAILRLRAELGLFANLRPARAYAPLAAASPLKPERFARFDLLIVRELTGDVYFGTPRGRRTNERGLAEGYDTMRYDEGEVRRIARVAFEAARERRRRVCSVDKANVLETSQFWREVVADEARHHPQVELEHMYVDNCAMQLALAPDRFDVILTGNLFGDILSDEAGALTGSIGMLPSASLGEKGRGLYEPIHGSAPDIAGRDRANPLAAILSAALMLRHSLGEPQAAARIEAAVEAVLAEGWRTADIAAVGERPIGTAAMAAKVMEKL